MDGEPRSWPDLIGKTGKEAVEIIKKDGIEIEKNLSL
jgi:hypothetical protein